MRSAWRWNRFAKTRGGRAGRPRGACRSGRSAMAFMAPKMAVSASSGSGRGAVAVVLEGPVGVQHQLVERVGRGAGTVGVVSLDGGRGGGFVEHGGLPFGESRDRRGLRGDRKARGGTGPPAALTPRGGQGAGAERRTAIAGSFCFAMQRPTAGGKSWRSPLRAGPFLAPVAVRRRPKRGPLPRWPGALLNRGPLPSHGDPALAALRRPARSLRAGAASATAVSGRVAPRCARRARPSRASLSRC